MQGRLLVCSYGAVGLRCSYLYHLIYGTDDAVGVLTTCSSEVCLATATTLDELSCLAYELTCIHALGGEILASRYGEQGLAAINATDDYEQVFSNLSTELEDDILHCLSRHGHYGLDHVYTIHAGHLLHQLSLERCSLLLHELLNLLLQIVMLSDELGDGSLQVGSVVEELTDVVERILQLILHLLYLSTGDSLDTAYASRNTALAHDLHHTNLTGSAHVSTATELDRVTELDYTYEVTILLTKECDSTQLASLLDGEVAVFVELHIGADLGIHEVLYLAQLLVGHLLEV